MRPAFTARRAEEFHSLVEDASTDEARDERHAELVGLVAALREQPDPEARPEFVADLRSRLMTAAESALAPGTPKLSTQPSAKLSTPTPVPANSRRERRLAGVVGGFAIVSATASMSVAAQSAIPGDTLYPLKRAIENAQTVTQFDTDDRGLALLDNASGRLAEVVELSDGDVLESETVSSDIAATLQDFTQQSSEASDLLLEDYAATGNDASIEELRSFTSRSLATLHQLEDRIPVEVRASLIEAARVLAIIDQRAAEACPTCSDLPVTAAPLLAAKPVLDPVLGLVESSARDREAGESSPEPAPQDRAGRSEQQPPPESSAGADPEPSPAPGAEQGQRRPELPSLSGGPRSTETESGDRRGKGSVEKLTEDVNGGLGVDSRDDPVGDLLTDTGEAVDNALEGAGDMLDGKQGKGADRQGSGNKSSGGKDSDEGQGRGLPGLP